MKGYKNVGLLKTLNLNVEKGRKRNSQHWDSRYQSDNCKVVMGAYAKKFKNRGMNKLEEE